MVQVLMNILSNRGVEERDACLDALISIMLDSSANQMVYLVLHSIRGLPLHFMYLDPV